MVPIGLTIITCQEYDQLIEDEFGVPPGSAIGKHSICPKTPEEAHRIATGNFKGY